MSGKARRRSLTLRRLSDTTTKFLQHLRLIRKDSGYDSDDEAVGSDDEACSIRIDEAEEELPSSIHADEAPEELLALSGDEVSSTHTDEAEWSQTGQPRSLKERRRTSMAFALLLERQTIIQTLLDAEVDETQSQSADNAEERRLSQLEEASDGDDEESLRPRRGRADPDSGDSHSPGVDPCLAARLEKRQRRQMQAERKRRCPAKHSYGPVWGRPSCWDGMG